MTKTKHRQPNTKNGIFGTIKKKIILQRLKVKNDIVSPWTNFFINS